MEYPELEGPMGIMDPAPVPALTPQQSQPVHPWELCQTLLELWQPWGCAHSLGSLFSSKHPLGKSLSLISSLTLPWPSSSHSLGPVPVSGSRDQCLSLLSCPQGSCDAARSAPSLLFLRLNRPRASVSPYSSLQVLPHPCGFLWMLNSFRSSLYCGDAEDKAHFYSVFTSLTKQLMDDKRYVLMLDFITSLFKSAVIQEIWITPQLSGLGIAWSPGCSKIHPLVSLPDLQLHFWSTLG